MSAAQQIAAAAFLVLSCTVAAAAAPSEICLGVVLPFTGAGNLQSLQVLRTLQMATADMNASPLWKTTMPGTTLRLLDSDMSVMDSGGFVRFGTARMYEQITRRTCANGTNPIAIIGDLSEAVTREMAAVASVLRTPLISPVARNPVLTNDRNANAYVMVFRSSLQGEADLIIDIIRQYGWTSVVLWHSDSDFGSAFSSSFEGSGLDVLDVPVPANDLGLKTQLATTRILALRIRVIIVHAEPELAKLMMNYANRAGMMNGDYLWFGTLAWTFGTDSGYSTFNQEESKYMQGVVGIQLGSTTGPITSKLQKFAPELYPPYQLEYPVTLQVVSYDAITAIALSVMNLTATGQPIVGDTLMSSLLGPTTSFVSVGLKPIVMNPVTGARIPRFAVSNFQNGKFVQVGTWSPAGLVMTGKIVWPGLNSEERPAQEVPRVHVPLNPVLPQAAIAVAVMYGLGSILLHYLIYLNREHEVIKASSPIFCHVILFGGDIAYLMAALSTIDDTAACSVVPSLIAISFSLMFGALTAKTFRIHKIFNSEGLRIKTPTDTVLFIFTGTLIAFDIIVIAAWMGVDPPNSEWIPNPGNTTTAYMGCVMINSSAWSLALVIPKIAILLFGGWLAYKVRDLNHNFNEAKFISLALYNVLLLSALLFGLISAFPSATDTVFALKSIGSATVAFGTMLILFAPKFWDIYVTKDWVDYHSNSSYVSGVLVHKSSKLSHMHGGGTAPGHTGTGTGNGFATAEGVSIRIGTSTHGKENATSAGGGRPHISANGGSRGNGTPSQRWQSKIAAGAGAGAGAGASGTGGGGAGAAAGGGKTAVVSSSTPTSAGGAAASSTAKRDLPTTSTVAASATPTRISTRTALPHSMAGASVAVTIPNAVAPLATAAATTLTVTQSQQIVPTSTHGVLQLSPPTAVSPVPGPVPV